MFVLKYNIKVNFEVCYTQGSRYQGTCVLQRSLGKCFNVMAVLDFLFLQIRNKSNFEIMFVLKHNSEVNFKVCYTQGYRYQYSVDNETPLV